MNIERVETWWESIPLTRPYRIAHHATDSVELGFVQVFGDEGGAFGCGCAAPVEEITGESEVACREAILAMSGLSGSFSDVRRTLDSDYRATPAARAALDMAVLDAMSRRYGVGFDFAGRRAERAFPTSITIGIRSMADTLAEADEYVGRGFTILKVKIGEDLAHDLERLARLRERIGPRIVLRADANLGYGPRDVERFFERAESIGVEFLEQPCPRALDDELRRLPASTRQRLAADESLFDDADAWRLAAEPRPFGVWNIKLMKCGGVVPAVKIAFIAERFEVDLMWGCMDESVASIAAALHLACSAERTRYLDLDGSFDLARDPFRGGFELRDGKLHTVDAPGLGVERNA